MATPFETFVNGELPKRVSTEDSPISWTPGRVVVTTGVGLGVTTDEFPAPPVLSVNSDVGDVVITAASISAIPTSQKGAANGVASLDANGFVPLSQMNPGVVERLYVVTDEVARFALTTAQVQNGDVVKQELPAPAAMYYVQDDTNLDSELGYAIFAVGTAAAVAWSGVTGVPQILLDLENISGAVTGDILQFDGTNWVKQSRNAYVSGLALQVSEIDGLQNDLDGKQDHDLTLDALSDLPDTGFIVQIAPDSFASRSLEAGDGISITFPDGVDGNPLIAFQEGPAEASGTHGDENTYLGLDIDSHGRTTAVTEYKLQKDTVYIPNSTDPFTLETKTQYMIGDFLTATYGDLYLQLPPLTASTVIEIQLAFEIEQVGHVYITPSGTDLIFGQGTPLDLKILQIAPGCTVKLFFHSVGLGWIVQANYSDHLIKPKIQRFNAASFDIGHTINSQATSDLNLTLPDANIDLGDPITYLAFGRDTDVLTATRVDGVEITTLLDQDHMDELLSPDGGFVGVPLLVGRTYRPAGSVAIYSPDTPVYLPLATADAFNSHESVPIRLMTGNSILNAGYLRLTPQVGETMYHSAINGSVVTSTYLPIPNNSEVTCYMIGVGKWYVDIRQDSNYLDTDHFTLVDPTLRSKSVKFNVAPVGGGGSAQRTITVPDADVSLGKVPTGVTPTYATGRLMVPLADGTSIPLSAFGGTRLANLNSPATVLTANGHYLFYSNTGSYYTVICALVLPTAPDDMTYVRISNISSLNSFSVDAGATVAPGGSDKINGVVATLDITDYLVNYRNAVITLTYSAFSENWTVSVLGDLIKPGTVAIYDADKTNTTTLTPVTNLTSNRVITLPDANVDLGKVLSNISYAPTTGVITLTNVDASTFATTNIGAIADDMLRIQATGAATKKMGFNCSAVTAGQTRIVTMPDANVDLGNIPTALTYSPSTATLSTGGLSTNIAPISDYAVGVVYSVGALVYHQQHTWKVIVAHTGSIPFVNGRLELLGEVFRVFVQTTPYLAPRLGANSGVADKILDVNLYNNSATTVNISDAPMKIIIRQAWFSGSRALTITKTHATLNVSLIGDDGTTLVTPALTVSHTFNLAAGAEVEILNFSSSAVIFLKKQNTIGRFKLNDVSSTLDANKNNGWLFSGSATAPRTITMPDADVDLGQMVKLSDLRTTVNPQSATTYTIASADVNAFGSVIVECSNASPITVTVPAPSALTPAKVTGDKVHIRQGGTGTVTITGTLAGNLVFNGQYDTRTLVATSSSAWMVIGG